MTSGREVLSVGEEAVLEHSQSESSAYEEEEEDESASSYSFDDDSYLLRRNLLFLCSEGQLALANQRFDNLMMNNGQEQQQRLRQEIFQLGSDKNSALHEIFIGGVSDRNANSLARKMLQFTTAYYPEKLWKLMQMQPPSHQRTVLHWACWCNADLDFLKKIVNGNPEALLLKDKKNKGWRTPVELYYYYFVNEERAESSASQSNIDKYSYLTACLGSWKRHRLRNAIYASMLHYFHTLGQTPFDQKDRKGVKVKPKPWFLLSVLGYFYQRQMQPLVFRILEYVGYEATVKKMTATATKKRKRKS